MIRLLRNSSDSDSDDGMPRQRRPRAFRPRININFRTAYEFNERFGFRMSSTQMENVLTEIGGALESQSNKNNPMSSKLQLCVALHWLGTGCQYHAVGDMHGVSKTSVHKAIHGVIGAVNARLFNNVVAWPEHINEVVQQYHAIAGMPLVIGSVDGTLIEIDAPQQREEVC